MLKRKMDNEQKKELRYTVREIPKSMLKFYTIKELWRRYGDDFGYGTFRKYLLIFRKEDMSKKLKND